MADDIKDIYDKLNSISVDLATIKASQEDIHAFIELYNKLDNRVRMIEISGHTCVQASKIDMISQYIQTQQGAQSAQKPFWDTFKTIFAGVIIGIIMLVVGYGIGKN